MAHFEERALFLDPEEQELVHRAQIRGSFDDADTLVFSTMFLSFGLVRKALCKWGRGPKAWCRLPPRGSAMAPVTCEGEGTQSPYSSSDISAAFRKC